MALDVSPHSIAWRVNLFLKRKSIFFGEIRENYQRSQAHRSRKEASVQIYMMLSQSSSIPCEEREGPCEGPSLPGCPADSKGEKDSKEK